jgi:hypothetical protein
LAGSTVNLEEKNSYPGGILTLIIQPTESHFTSYLGPDIVMSPDEITENNIQFENQTDRPTVKIWMAQRV